MANGAVSGYRLRWIELPEGNGSSIGAIIFSPKHSDNQSQPNLTCNLAAGWGSSISSVQSADSILGGSVSSSAKLAVGIGVGEVPIQVSNSPAKEGGARSVFTYPYFPQRPISMTQGWADALNPRINSTNNTVINERMQEQERPHDQKSYALFGLNGLVANGFSRIGFSSRLQGNVKTISVNGSVELIGNYWLSGKEDVFNATEAKDWTKLHMTSALQGHSYNII